MSAASETTISPRGGSLQDIGEVWRFRELVLALALRDVRVRYSQAVFGVLWVLLQPAISAVVFAVVLGRLAGVASDDVPYATFVVTGLVPWLFVANAASNAGTSLINAAPLLHKVYFPRLVLPLAAVLGQVLDLAVALPLAVGVALLDGALGPSVLAAPLLAAGLLLPALAVGILIASLNVAFRDFRYVVAFFLQIWMFCTPVVYPLSLVPERWRAWAYLNPVTGFLDGFRSAVCGTPIRWEGVGLSLASSLVLLAIATAAFTRVDKNLADSL